VQPDRLLRISFDSMPVPRKEGLADSFLASPSRVVQTGTRLLGIHLAISIGIRIGGAIFLAFGLHIRILL